MVDGKGLNCICCQVSNLHSININSEPLSGVAGTVGLILKQRSCTQEQYIEELCTVLKGTITYYTGTVLKEHEQYALQTVQNTGKNTGMHYITMSCMASSYIK